MKTICYAFCGLAAFAAAAASAGGPTHGSDITVDAGQVIGKMRPLQDLGVGPLDQRGFVDLTEYYKALGVRNVRVHDQLLFGDVVDINYVFRHDDADPAKPENYDFALTDYLLKSMTSLGINVIYRLGYSADYTMPPELRHITPPKSYERWSEVAAHIVSHYGVGWANGPKEHIKYWEIWNEPDNPYFFTGSADDYYRLYETTARKIKAADPSAKVGGPALATMDNSTLDSYTKPGFLKGFLTYCRDHKVPLDFVSWHHYTNNPRDFASSAKGVRDLMSQYGYGSAESILDEWNSLAFMSMMKGINDWEGKSKYRNLTRSEFGAAFNATALISLQDAPVDIATFYSGTTLMFGLFNPDGGPTKAYDSFLAFRQILDTPKRLEVKGADTGDVTALAGLSDDASALHVLVAYTGSGKTDVRLRLQNLPWGAAGAYSLQAINARADFAATKPGKAGKNGAVAINMDGPSVYLLTVKSPGH